MFDDFALKLTGKETASRAAKARMSEQETTPGHTLSIWDLISSITSKPNSERLGLASFSAAAFVPTVSNSIDASHPCHACLNKCYMQIYILQKMLLKK